jgi:5-methylcytosine-specific restriction enzyme subunit McrC
VYSDAAGRWRAGRFIGSLVMGDIRLDIKPRFPFEVLLSWLDTAYNFIAIPDAAQLHEAESFVPWLMAMLWSRRLDQACRHGLPALRMEAVHEGRLARGRIDVAGTVRLRRRQPEHLVSRTRERTLNNDIGRTVICAENALKYATRSDKWQPRRVRDLCAQMREAVGPRPILPSEPELRRIRYTPIRLPFRNLVAFSHRLARQRGYLSSTRGDKADGILLDVAELWELFMVGCVRSACPDLRVEHGTRTFATQPTHLLYSTVRPDLGLGELYPDILVSDDHGVAAVVDAKYKRLAWAPDRPDGVERGDRYQLISYISRFRDGPRTFGALLYPQGMGQEAEATAERHAPWLTRDGNPIWFTRLPVERPACVLEIRKLLVPGEASVRPAAD